MQSYLTASLICTSFSSRRSVSTFVLGSNNSSDFNQGPTSFQSSKSNFNSSRLRVGSGSHELSMSHWRITETEPHTTVEGNMMNGRERDRERDREREIEREGCSGVDGKGQVSRVESTW